ncbi:hypothetical protein ACFP3Q_08305 [Nocardioides sp. GCM10027113]|uniref:hypothetical protein n=1 Tax=unclassified Nocardioides TaxID=2615069 RepID=UPI0036238E1B
MPDREVSERTERPVVAGLVALLGVGLAVGLVLGLAALAGTRMLGLGGDEVAAETTGGASLYLPRPVRTSANTDPLITLNAQPTQEPSQSGKPKKPEKSEKPAPVISLSAGQTAVAPMQQIDLTGVYQGGEGAVLQVQRYTGGAWKDFPVTVSVSDATFSTYVQTSQPGVNRFRVVDTDSGRKSNEVRIRIG